MSLLKKVAVAMTAAACIMGASATPAHAANQDAAQNYEEIIYFFNSGGQGAWSDFSINVSNLTGYSYIGGGSSANGFGQAVKNNAAYVRNWHRTRSVAVYYNSNHAGVAQVYSPLEGNNLIPALKNQNASHKFL